MVKHFFYAVLLTVIPVFAYSQEIKEVTLVVNGNGVTKEAATQIALRSAIEQAFGVFVSANTSILNDNLVKDEIATVSSGNIQKYTELGVIKLPDGQYAVTIQATVSINKLVKYAQSKGSECEFAGATFGANLKLLQLRYDNAKDALSHLREYTRIIGSHVFDYEISVGEPRTSNGDAIIPVTIKYIPNEMTKEYFNTVLKTLDATAFNIEEMRLLDGLDNRNNRKYQFYSLGKLLDYYHPYAGFFDSYRFGANRKIFPIAVEYNRDGNYIDYQSDCLMKDFENNVINGFVLKDDNGKVLDIKYIEDRSSSIHPYFSNIFIDNLVSYAPRNFEIKVKKIKGGKQSFNVAVPIEELSMISSLIVEPK